MHHRSRRGVWGKRKREEGDGWTDLMEEDTCHMRRRIHVI
jgi:hypothetical protein